MRAVPAGRRAWLGVGAMALFVLLLVQSGAARAQTAAAPALNWSPPEPFDLANGSLRSVSCPSASLCVAFDALGNVVTSTDPTGGSSKWSAGKVDTALNSQPQVSCGSTSRCVAVDQAGNAMRSTNAAGGASTWSAPAKIDDDGLSGVSCPSSSLCVAVDSGGRVVTTTDGGSTWTDPLDVETGVVLNGISCASTALCVAVDQSGNAVTSTDPGDATPTWTVVTGVDTFALLAVSCVPGAHSCVAVDNDGRAVSTTDDGAHWGTPATIGANILTGVSCPDTGLCIAVSPLGDISHSTDPFDATPTWSSLNVDPVGEPDAVSCPSVSLCVAVDGNGQALTATAPSSGNTSAWTAAEIDAGNGESNEPDGVSCPSAAFCAVVDVAGNVVTSTNPVGGAATWDSVSVASDTGFTGISCPTAALCVAIDGGGRVATSTDPAGGTWSAPFTVASQLFGVSCPSEAMCVAVDGNGFIASSLDPTDTSAWNDDNVEGPTAIDSISCPTESFCVAGDGAGNVLTSTDPTSGTWTTTSVGDLRSTFLAAVACPTASLCVLGDGAGDLITSTDPTGGGSTWKLQNVDGNHLINSISCPSSDFCVAADNAGNVLTSTNPGDASPTWTSKSVDDNSITGVSCPSALFCTAVDSLGNVLVAAAPPSVTTGSAGSIGQTSATVSGTVNPNGLSVSDCHFSYGVGSPSGTNVPCSPSPGSGTSDVPVSAQLSGLTAGTAYQFRLVATTAAGTKVGATGMFTTLSPLPPTFTLTVAKSGPGSGTVTSSPAGIDCGATCSHAYTQGTEVTLSAAADSGSMFDGWSGGGCSGVGTCTVTMNSDTTVTASFIPPIVPAPLRCIVPKVKGKTLKAAKRAIKSHHCSVGKIRHAASRRVKKGHVISQKPKPGKHLRRGAKVNLVVSKGRR
jgi:PASTA domain/Divergent InlB B-repeat domain